MENEIIPLRANNLELSNGVMFAGTAPIFRELGTDEGSKGTVYIFKQEQNVWSFFKGLTASFKDTNPIDGNANSLFGASFAVSGSRIVIGSPSHNQDAGAFYIFEE